MELDAPVTRTSLRLQNVEVLASREVQLPCKPDPAYIANVLKLGSRLLRVKFTLTFWFCRFPCDCRRSGRFAKASARASSTLGISTSRGSGIWVVMTT